MICNAATTSCQSYFGGHSLPHICHIVESSELHFTRSQTALPWLKAKPRFVLYVNPSTMDNFDCQLKMLEI